MPKIFISYRREDSQHQADRLHGILKKHVPNANRDIFIDVDNIPVGVDFIQHLDSKVAECDILLALIGPGWLTAKNPTTGKRRLDDPQDFVRIEIASALKRDIPVAPILLDGAPFPAIEELPDDLKSLIRRNGVEVRRLTFNTDAERLIRGLGLVRTDEGSTAPPSLAAKPKSQATWPDIAVRFQPIGAMIPSPIRRLCQCQSNSWKRRIVYSTFGGTSPSSRENASPDLLSGLQA